MFCFCNGPLKKKLRVWAAAAAIVSATLVPAASAGASANAVLTVLPSDARPAASYTVHFRLHYGGYGEVYDGVLQLAQISASSVSISGKTMRLAGDEFASPASRPMLQRLAPQIVARETGDGALSVAADKVGVGDLAFDYNSLIALLPQHATSPPSLTQWTASTTCWVSDTVSAPIPVRVRETRSGDTLALHAIGQSRVPLATGPGAAVTTISIDMTDIFHNNTLVRADMHAREVTQRNGLPAGGGTYFWTINLREDEHDH